jgi:hypothetical protein
LVQITRTTPRRRTILHLAQIRFTDALTFMIQPLHFRHDPDSGRFLSYEFDNHPSAD